MEIKFRRKDLVKTMRRVDPVYTGLSERLGQSTGGLALLTRRLTRHQTPAGGGPEVLRWVQQTSPKPQTGLEVGTLVKIHN